MESSNLDTPSIRNKWHCWKRRKTSEKRHLSSIATVRIGWEMVGWFYGMLLLSTKCPRLPGRRENAVRKTIWRTIQWAKNTFWSNGWVSPVFTERSVENSSISQESISRNLSRLRTDREENLERRYLESRRGRFGKIGYIRYLSSKNQSKGSIDQPKRWWIRFPIRRWNSKIVRKRLRIPSTHSKAGTTCKEWRSQWRSSRRLGRASTGETNRWRWSLYRILVDSRWLHLSSSQWSMSTTLCAKRRSIPYSSKLHWCY